MSERHQYQHVAMAVRSGETIEQAIFNAVAVSPTRKATMAI
jgi:hypothetical protein